MRKAKNESAEAIYLFVCAGLYFITPLVLFFIGTAIAGFLPRILVTPVKMALEARDSGIYLAAVGLLLLLVLVKVLLDFFRKIKAVGNFLAGLGSAWGMAVLWTLNWTVYLTDSWMSPIFNNQIVTFVLLVIVPLVPTILLIVAGVRKVRKNEKN